MITNSWQFTAVSNVCKIKNAGTNDLLYFPMNSIIINRINDVTTELRLVGINRTYYVDYTDVVTPSGLASSDDLITALTGLFYVASGGGGGGGSSTYAQASPSNTTVGGLNAGTSLTGLALDVILQKMLVSYLSPAFTAFSITGQSTSVEVGTTLSGSKTFTWSTSNSSNVSANTIAIKDITASTTLASGLGNTGSSSRTIATVTRTTPGTYQWQAQGTNTNSVVFNSSLFTVSWFYKAFYGTSSSASLDATAIHALTSSGLASGFAGAYVFASGNYKWICYPDSFGSPTASTGFKDSSTGFVVAMADSTDDASFSNVQNGWSYSLVSVTNGLGVTTNYRAYRTKNSLGGAITINVS